MMYIGAHVSIAGGVQTAPQRAIDLEATALGLFTKNQRQWAAKPLDVEQIREFRDGLDRSGISQEHAVIHSSYLINIANPDPEKRLKSVAALLEECLRAEQLGLSLVNFHPGSGMGEITDDESIDLIAQGCRAILDRTTTAVLVLECTAGQGAHVGHRFSHLGQIIRSAGSPERLRICVDSCHVFAAGYDVRKPDGYEQMMSEIEHEVGLDRLVAIHLNDSKSELGSRTDRHDQIGDGRIGLEGLANFVRDPRLADLPFVLETPDPDRWKDEIALLAAIAAGAPITSVAPPARTQKDT